VDRGFPHRVRRLGPEKEDDAPRLALHRTSRHDQLDIIWLLVRAALIRLNLTQGLAEEQQPRRLGASREEALQCRPVVPAGQHLLHRRCWHVELLRQQLGHVLVPRIHPHGVGACLWDRCGVPL
jgi:hypothetical protein